MDHLKPDQGGHAGHIAKRHMSVRLVTISCLISKATGLNSGHLPQPGIHPEQITSILQFVAGSIHYWRLWFMGETKSNLLDDGVLPDHFLQDNHIRVIAQDFENAGSEADHIPPILFEPRPPNFLEDYPVNPNLVKDPLAEKSLMHYIESTETPFCDWSLSGRLSVFPRASADYLFGWAYGTGVPRDFVVEMFPLVGIEPVQGNHGLYLGFDVFDSAVGQQYTSHVLEYNCEFHGVKPHVILLGAQANIGHNGSIMYGELAIILSAMRNRAYQPSVVIDSDESDPEVNIEDEEDLLFKDEQRFPVLMVSIVGPQHGRIFYACMDGLDLVIRQSPLYSLEKRNDTILNFLSGFLLSKPLDETS